ncbi:MAG TPA: phosphoglycolate phosphatase [Steroidobacter sp.]|uniref:phosphoglycolate phosphatase n=1 Tax=Steroidobacter sp. TaxID=1978227 RepID=UPI002EDA5EF1
MPKLMDSIEAVAFDLDGTLVDTAPDLGAAANMMLIMLGGRPLPDDQIPSMIGAGIDALVMRVLARNGITPDPALHAMAGTLFRNLYGQRVFERSSLYPGVVTTLHRLRADGRTLYCVTNKERKFALPLLESAGLKGFFASVYCSDRPEDRKPSANMLRAACTHACVEPERMLCVGDSLADISAARSAGCRVVAVDYGYHHDQPLAELRPDGVVSNIQEILELRVPRSPTLRAIA